MQKARTQLRNRKEQSDGVTCESNMNLLQIEKRDSDTVKTSEMSISTLADPFSAESKCIVIFDLETSGFEMNCDVLQIACKCGYVVFNDYIRPTKCISPKVTEKNGLSDVEGELFLLGHKIKSNPLRRDENKYYRRSYCYTFIQFGVQRSRERLCRARLLRPFHMGAE